MKSKLDLLVLGLLMKRPMHGYELHQKLSSEEMEQWVDIGFTSIYHALSRLKKSGLVVETVDTSSNKQKNIYRLTPSGREAFMEQLRCALADQSKLMLAYNVPLYFINNLSPAEAAMALRIRESFLRSWLATLGEIPAIEMHEEATIKLIIDHTRAITEREIEWLRSLADSIEGRTAMGSETGSNRTLHLMTMRGNLRDRAVSDLVGMISAEGRTGTLSLERGAKKCSIAFKDGRPTHASSSTSSKFKEKRSSKDGKFAKSVEGNLALRVLEDVYDAFGWPDGNYVFDPNRSIKKDSIAIDIRAEDLILEGARRVDDWDRIRSIVPSDDAIFDHASSSTAVTEAIKLNEREQKALGAINGVRDVQTVAELCNLSVFETSKVLYALSILGLISLIPSDKADVVRVFREFVRILLERIYAVAGERVLLKVEADANESSKALSLPFRCQSGALNEDLKPGIGLTELIDEAKNFLSLLAKTIAKQIGKSFTRSLIEPIPNRLPPDMAADFVRYGFAEALSEIQGPPK